MVEKLENVITIDEWAKQNIISDFEAPDEETFNILKEKYPLKPLKSEDMYFTDEIEDDRINSTAILSDYDWMCYKYDTRFPTEDIGTLSVRFEYIGATFSFMFVKQFLPSYLTGLDKNYVICREFEYPTSVFHEYFRKELTARINSFDSPYAYNADEVLLEWFNTVLEINNERPCDIRINEKFAWESVRIPKNKKG